MDRLLVSDCLSLMLADYVYQYEQTLLYVCSEPCSKYMVLRQVFPYDCFHLGPWGARSTRACGEPFANLQQDGGSTYWPPYIQQIKWGLLLMDAQFQKVDFDQGEKKMFTQTCKFYEHIFNVYNR